MLAVLSLCQLQYVRQIIVLHKVSVSCCLEGFVQIGVFEVFSSIVQVRIAHLYYIGVLAGGHSCLQVLRQSLVHIRIIFFDNLDIRVSFIKISYQLLNSCTAEAFCSYMPIFNLHLLAGISGLFIAATANHSRGCQQRNHCCCQNFFEFHYFIPPFVFTNIKISCCLALQLVISVTAEC